MKFFILVFFIVLANPVPANEEPSIESLSADSFEERELAQEKIAGWVLANHEGAKEHLLAQYLRSASPEIKARLIPLLERAYFKPKGYVGIMMIPTVDAKLRAWPNGLPQVAKSGMGVQLTRVLPGTPAEASGLKENDIVLKINDWEVRGVYADLVSQAADEIQRHPPLTPLNLKVKRGEESVEIKLKLGVLPVPSEREREIMAINRGFPGSVPEEITKQVKEFQTWLGVEIEKERKNLIADRRL